jgi:hypothetical protein
MKQLLAIVFLLTGSLTYAQTEDSVRVKPFTGIVTSPRVHLVLQEGPVAQVRIVCHGVPRNRVNVKVTGHTLRIFLDHARILERQVRYSPHGSKRGLYQGSSITAYVTYQTLNRIEMRGEESLTAAGTIHADKLKLKLYGVTSVDLKNVDADKLKVSLFGENNVLIRDGHANVQVYRLFGDNGIDTQGMKSTTAAARMYGEGKIKLSVRDAIHIHAFGEPVVRISGTPLITHGIILGQLDLRHEN